MCCAFPHVFCTLELHPSVYGLLLSIEKCNRFGPWKIQSMSTKTARVRERRCVIQDILWTRKLNKQYFFYLKFVIFLRNLKSN